VLIAEERGTPVGYVAGRVVTKGGDARRHQRRVLIADAMYVEPESRMGSKDTANETAATTRTSRLLYDELVRRARKQGVKLVVCDYWQGNNSAERFISELPAAARYVQTKVTLVLE